MRVFKLSGLCFSLMFLLCHCQCRSDWPKFRFNLQNSGYNLCENSENTLNPGNVGSLFQVWAATTGGWVGSSPAVVNGTVYVGSEDGNLYAFNIFNGLPRPGWPLAIGSGIFSPAVANGVVYASQFGGSLFAFDAATGAPKPGGWPVTTNCDIGTSPTVANGVVYVGSFTIPGKLFAFDANSAPCSGPPLPAQPFPPLRQLPTGWSMSVHETLTISFTPSMLPPVPYFGVPPLEAPFISLLR